jgi:hypothetical protein
LTDKTLAGVWGLAPRAPYQAHSDTSRESAEAIAPKAGTYLAQVAAYLKACDVHGATDDEMQVVLGMDPSTQRPRRIDLVKRGMVRASEMQRPTRKGRKATVWVWV